MLIQVFSSVPIAWDLVTHAPTLAYVSWVVWSCK